MKKSLKRQEFDRLHSRQITEIGAGLMRDGKNGSMTTNQAMIIVYRLLLVCFQFGINPVPRLRECMSYFEWTSIKFGKKLEPATRFIWVFPWMELIIATPKKTPAGAPMNYVISYFEDRWVMQVLSANSSSSYRTVHKSFPHLDHDLEMYSYVATAAFACIRDAKGNRVDLTPLKRILVEAGYEFPKSK